jgi:hypothetical protein
MKTFHCDQCSQQVFFENILCERCGSMLGYLSDLRDISAFEPVEPDQWRSLNPQAGQRLYRKCDNYSQHNVCNWMIPAESTDTLCSSCQLTQTIPALSVAPNIERWYKLERAKRRLLYSLASLKLPIVSKRDEPQQGLAFEFLAAAGPGKGVLTGHDEGLITLNIAEADDAHREQVRTAMNEPYRTLLGHFRHESGHYYFMRIMSDPAVLEQFRAYFGDERVSYADSLERHYKQGPAPQWEQSFVSAYASSHPWEDWAETWAHYLHLSDTLETAHACGLALNPHSDDEPSIEAPPPGVDITWFEKMIDQWFALTYVLNSLNRSLGMPDGYPFTLAPPVVEKLRFVHDVIHGNRLRPPKFKALNQTNPTIQTNPTTQTNLANQANQG